jgi:transcriptional regulator with XRE-family HTH domain
MTQAVQDAAQVRSAVIGRVRTLRKARGWTAERLAAEMRGRGIAWERSIVANLENGRRASLDVAELVALADLFGTTPAVLLEGGQVTTVVVTV